MGFTTFTIYFIFLFFCFYFDLHLDVPSGKRGNAGETAVFTSEGENFQYACTTPFKTQIAPLSPSLKKTNTKNIKEYEKKKNFGKT